MDKPSWQVVQDRPVLAHEVNYWITPCYEYRERRRVRKNSITQYSSSLSSDSGKIPAQQSGAIAAVWNWNDTDYLFDRSNTDRWARPDYGSNFKLDRTEWSYDLSVRFRKKIPAPGGAGVALTGPLVPRLTVGEANTAMPVRISDTQLDALGASLVSRAIPTSPHANTSVALAELVHDMPSIIGRQLLRAPNLLKGGADEFLNWQFALKPLINDVKKTLYAVKHSKELLDAFDRNNGRPIRRRRVNPILVDQNLTYSGNTYCYGRSDVYGAFGPGSAHVLTTQESWFAGSFQYHIPVSNKTRDRMTDFAAKADYLLGLKITPEVLWELTPWSWLLDWFTNAQEVYKNISLLGSNGLVMRYGYVCHRRIRTVTRTCYPGLPANAEWIGGNPIAVSTETHTQMSRRKAQPYGFGIADASLSGTQLAILAALGLSRGSRSGSPD